MKTVKTVKEKCACCGSNLDRFVQPVVLAVLNKEPLTGYAVIKRMEDYVTFQDFAPDPTGVYRYLKIMRQKGLICRDEDGDGAAPLYRITPQGKACLVSWRDTLKEYASRIEELAAQLADKE